jgi:hypothetical protein
MFTYELQRRLTAAGAATSALAAHPGGARTEFGRDLPLPVRVAMSPWLHPLTFWLIHSAQAGALPIARAATDPQARGGEYYGPAGPNEWTGRPVLTQPVAAARDSAAQRRLWEVSEQLTGVTYRITAPSGQPG